jgi:transketolase C-terminal domain/subunit
MNEAFDGYRFTLGKGVTVYDRGTDVGLISTGYMIKTAKLAAEKLARRGIGARIDHHPTLKPFDRELLCDMARKVSALVTLENHCVSGGLYSLVAETLAHHGIGVPVGAIGTDPDDFIHTGHVNDLLYRYKMTSEDVVALAREMLARGE